MQFCGEFQAVRRKQACFLTTHIYIYTHIDGRKRITLWRLRAQGNNQCVRSYALLKPLHITAIAVRKWASSKNKFVWASIDFRSVGDSTELATVCFKSCSCPYKVVIIISADLSQRRNCDTKEDADE